MGDAAPRQAFLVRVRRTITVFLPFLPTGLGQGSGDIVKIFLGGEEVVDSQAEREEDRRLTPID